MAEAKKEAAAKEVVKKEGAVTKGAAPKKELPKRGRTKKEIEFANTPREKRKCAIGSCKQSYKAKGYCKKHYKKWRNGEYGLARYKTCATMDCRTPMADHRFGYCEAHYQEKYNKQSKAHSAPEAAPAAAPAADEKATA